MTALPAPSSTHTSLGRYRLQDERASLKLKRVYFFWIAPDTTSFEWFSDLLHNLEQQVPSHPSHCTHLYTPTSHTCTHLYTHTSHTCTLPPHTPVHTCTHTPHTPVHAHLTHLYTPTSHTCTHTPHTPVHAHLTHVPVHANTNALCGLPLQLAF